MKLLKSIALCAIAAVPLTCFMAGTDAPAAPPVPNYQARKLCELGDERIDESSGLAASRRYPGYLWTHNDSGDNSRLFLINQQGQTVATVLLEGAGARDWEDMAVAGKGSDAWVYVGDIGDNLGWRPTVVIYRWREPELDFSKGAVSLTVPCERLILAYPDGPHDAETLLATTEGNLIIVTKTMGASLIFKTPQPFKAGATQKLERVGTYRFGAANGFGALTTGGDLSPDGKRLVIRTYLQAYEWNLPAQSPWTAVWQITPHAFALPATKQGEAICYSADGNSLFTTSEKRPTPLWQLTP
ncbi:MAG TPA: hypothetical protein VNA16_07790 [Abditibacteriaceae bacterium]|nr:hypothetical protein [Abditibacteriaceae bacterium]